MKRIYIHALALFTLAFSYTKGSILTVFMYYIPPFAQVMLISFFIIFLYFLAWLKRHEHDDFKPISWISMLKVAVLGSLFGYFLQLINIFTYLKVRHIPTDIGLFEDEFYRSVVFLFPCLLVAECIYKASKNSLLKYFGLTALVFVLCGWQINHLLSVDKPKTYPSVLKASADKPNVILILADDLGVGDLSLNGQKKYSTPNIDKLAAEGVNFTNAFCSAPICSPSRVGLLTGEYQQRYGFEHLTDGFSTHPYARKADFEKYGHIMGENSYWWDLEIAKRGIDPETTTLAEFLKEDGYATAIIGKWHLGLLPRFLPHNNGFDYFLGTYSAGMFYLSPQDERLEEYFHKDNFFEKLEHQLMVYKLFENGKPLQSKKEVYTTELFTQKGIEFIEKNKGNRFFLYLPFNAVHGPFQAPKRIYDKLTHIENHDERVYAAMVTSLDEAVGQIRQKLEESQLADNTIIVFASDNGAPLYFPAGTNAPLYGGKMSGFEGGLRVPFVIHWKNHIQPTQYVEHVSLIDVFKTIAGAIGREVPKNVAQDGINLLPFITSRDTLQTPHKMLFWRVGYVKVVRKGDWKLDINEKEGFTLLHNLKNDPLETQNLANVQVEKVEELKKELANWEKDLKNPNWRQSLDAKIEDGRGNRFYFAW